MFKKIKKWSMSLVTISMTVSITLSSASFGVNAAEAPVMSKVREEIITRGAMLQYYEGKLTNELVKAYVTKIDLQDPYIKIDTIYGKNQLMGQRQSIQKMAEENQAIAAINGDFFDMTTGSALGPMMADRTWLTTPSGIEGMNAFALSEKNVPAILPFGYNGELQIDGFLFPVYGINKTISMVDKINIYDSIWDLTKWPGQQLDSYFVAVIENGQVVATLENQKPVSIPTNGYIILGHGQGEQFLRDHATLGQKVSFNYRIDPLNDWATVIGGHTLLVDQGKRAAYTRDVSSIAGVNARTAVGYSKDSKYLYWVLVEKSKTSSGMTLEQLANFMIQIGVERGVNLDGGGSSTIVSRNLGDFNLSLINIPKEGSQRLVPNGLALYSTAPAGVLTDVFFDLPDFLLKEETFIANPKGIDQYFNPISLAEQNLNWASTYHFIDVIGNQLIGKKVGLDQIHVQSATMKKQYELEVIGKDQMLLMDLGIPILKVSPGELKNLKPVIQTKSGKTRTVSASLLDWEWVDISGTVQADGTVQVNDGANTGWLIGSYDRFSAMIPVQAGFIQEMIFNFENTEFLLQFSGLPNDTKGEFKLTDGEKTDGKYSGRLTYRFSEATDELKIAYGKLGDKGISFSKEAKGLTLWVYGDNSNHWLRSEIVDKNGKVHFITLADHINWTGWKEISVDFPAMIDSPTLKKLYLVNQEQDQKTRPLEGKILFDQIRFQTWKDLPQRKDVTIKLFVNKKQMIIDQEKQEIDQPPVIINGRSYIPVRFVTEALGGRIFWDGTDRRVRILLGQEMIDLWIDDKEHTIVNGINQPSDVAPLIRNNRTLIPVRMVTESLGYSVDWNNGEITIK